MTCWYIALKITGDKYTFKLLSCFMTDVKPQPIQAAGATIQAFLLFAIDFKAFTKSICTLGPPAPCIAKSIGLSVES